MNAVFRGYNFHEGKDANVNEPNEETYAAMEAAENDEDTYGPYDSVEELMTVLFLGCNREICDRARTHVYRECEPSASLG